MKFSKKNIYTCICIYKYTSVVKVNLKRNIKVIVSRKKVWHFLKKRHAIKILGLERGLSGQRSWVQFPALAWQDTTIWCCLLAYRCTCRQSTHIHKIHKQYIKILKIIQAAHTFRPALRMQRQVDLCEFKASLQRESQDSQFTVPDSESLSQNQTKHLKTKSMDGGDNI